MLFTFLLELFQFLLLISTLSSTYQYRSGMSQYYDIIESVKEDA